MFHQDGVRSIRDNEDHCLSHLDDILNLRMIDVFGLLQSPFASSIRAPCEMDPIYRPRADSIMLRP